MKKKDSFKQFVLNFSKFVQILPRRGLNAKKTSAFKGRTFYRKLCKFELIDHDIRRHEVISLHFSAIDINGFNI